MKIKPSLMSLRTAWRELALAISEASLGSSQTLRLPAFKMEAARRRCRVKFGLFIAGREREQEQIKKAENVCERER